MILSFFCVAVIVDAVTDADFVAVKFIVERGEILIR